MPGVRLPDQQQSLLQNILALYGVQVVTYILPLVTVPYLTRTLGVVAWGQLAFAQAFAAYAVIVVEYGFNLSATREVARHRHDATLLAHLLGDVLGAKALLILTVSGAALLVGPHIPVFRDHPLLLWAAVALAAGQGASIMWYFQGQERMRLVARLDVAARVLATLGIFLLVREPRDNWRVLALTGVAALMSSSVAVAVAWVEVGFFRPSLRGAVRALTLGWSMFVFKSSVSLYTAGNAFVLGLFVGPAAVGYYAGAERISKAALGLIGPVSQALYPRVTHLVLTARDRAAALVRLGVRLLGAGAVVVSAAMFLGAPLLVRGLLGADFTPAVAVLRIFSLLPPLIAVSNVLGVQWMLPLGIDRPFNAIILASGLLNLSVAIFLAPRFAQTGMAVSVVIAEAVVTTCMVLVLWNRHLSPFSTTFREAAKLDRER